jgi:type II secretory pathway component GspD/PulD (secretin)
MALLFSRNVTLKPPNLPLDMSKLLYLLCLFTFFVSVTSSTHAQGSGQTFRIDYDNGLLTLSAKKADLKTVLAHIAESAGIHVRFPKDLTKQITIDLSRVSLRKALRRVLKGENYALIYSVSGKLKPSAISEIYVLPKSSGPRTSRQYKHPRRRDEVMRASVARYEKRLETLKNRMTTVDEESRRGRLIRAQIRSTEKTIERLRRSLER